MQKPSGELRKAFTKELIQLLGFIVIVGMVA